MRSEGGGPSEIFLLVYETTRSHIAKYCQFQSDITPPEIKYLLHSPWCSIATCHYIILSYLLAYLQIVQNLYLTCRHSSAKDKAFLLYTQVPSCVFQKLSLES
jgi:hypothetical protein